MGFTRFLLCPGVDRKVELKAPTQKRTAPPSHVEWSQNLSTSPNRQAGSNPGHPERMSDLGGFRVDFAVSGHVRVAPGLSRHGTRASRRQRQNDYSLVIRVKPPQKK